MARYTLALILPVALAMNMDGRDGHGFVGYGIQMYYPPCAYSCSNSIGAPLNCSAADMSIDTQMDGMSGDEMAGDSTSSDGWMVQDSANAACKAHNEFYLQTLAYCVDQHCGGVPADDIEHYWLHDAVGRPKDQPTLILSLTQALEAATANGPPTVPLNNSLLLNYTALVADSDWKSTFDTLTNFETAETTHARYGLVLLLTGSLVPIFLSLLRFLPWPASLVSWTYAALLDPPLFGSSHDTPIWGLGLMPTRGQALFLVYLWTINIVLCAAGYDIGWPNAWFGSRGIVILTYVSNRTGVLSFANLPLVVLYASRNNVLLWLTNWRHETFLLLHRWIAFICMLQAVIHSAVYLKIYLVYDGYDHATQSRMQYWYWGIIATLSLVVLIPMSAQPFRQRAYECFLASHVLLSILALVGCLLHIWYRFAVQWGYETWLYMAAAIWAFDRVVRVGRWLRHGIKRATITMVDQDYYRIDIPRLAATGHVYLHFPTVNLLCFWENHPFSIAGLTGGPAPLLPHPPASSASSAAADEKKTETAQTSQDMARIPSPGDSSRHSQALPTAISAIPAPERDGELTTTIFVRRNAGLTARLAKAAALSHSSITLPVLVEGNYGPNVTCLQGSEVVPTPDYPHVLCIAGGVGITAVLPVLTRATEGYLGRQSTNTRRALGRVQLLWGARTWPLVHAVEDMLGVPASKREVLARQWGPIEVELAVGERLALRKLVEEALTERHRGTTVVVCGPPAMTDEVRCIVTGLSRHGNPRPLTRLVVESFSW